MDNDHNLGRRRYDNDHDLLVRVDERLLALTAMFSSAAVRLDAIETWRKSIDAWRSETDGEKRANARTIATIVSASSLLTALAVKMSERLVGP